MFCCTMFKLHIIISRMWEFEIPFIFLVVGVIKMSLWRGEPIYLNYNGFRASRGKTTQWYGVGVVGGR